MKLACDLIACALLSLLAAWLLWWAGARAAPVPRARPKVRPPLVGRKTVCWGGTRYDTTFEAGGYYACEGNGTRYEGTWRLDGDTLTITERPWGAPDAPAMTLAFKLAPGTLTAESGALTVLPFCP